MELKYPIIIIITILLLIMIYFIKAKKDKYTIGKKVANTKIVKESDYYKSVLKKYKKIYVIIQILCIISVLSCSILSSRPINITKKKNSEYSRDIMLCMDVSASVYELNLDIIKTLSETVKSLNGERFSISIFNTTTVNLVPLSDDYSFINNELDIINKSLVANINADYSDLYIANYILSGTIIGSDSRGSSLIGDGLASCIYNFPNLDNKERTKIIIFTTDNVLEGTPIISLSEASDIARDKNVIVYGIGTKNIFPDNKNEFQNEVLKTGGMYYDISSSSAKSIVSDIETKSKSLLEKEEQIVISDIPTIPYIISFVSVVVFLILSKKVIL